MTIPHCNYRRVGQCNRCGQCCQNVWPEIWPRAFFGRTQEWLERQFPIPALFGVPSPDNLSGEIEVDGYTIKYVWHKGIRKSLDSNDCPFLICEESDSIYSCILHKTRYDFWIKNCGAYPNSVMSSPERNMYHKDFPKCSYQWVPENQIKTIAKIE